MNFQDVIHTLESFWARKGCVVIQPYDLEVGAGTFHHGTTLRALGPEPWKAALASLAVPGSGQLWSGRRVGWGFVAAETVLIGGGIWAKAQGRSRQGDYERFADRYWEAICYMGTETQ